eukprot:GHVN01082229.1.p1 GENE.GHVN01082229.1~~GHVN01082229.1.p1  ORF type:complete len:513 (+),score=127.79 GHVN01082229.1:173-1540(+)
MSPQEAELLKERFVWLRDHLTPSHFMSMQQLLKQQTCEVLPCGEGSSWQRETETDEGGDREEEEDVEDGGANERSPTTGSEGDDESHIMVLEGIHAITTNTSQSTRLKLYAAGGVYAVSSRIMVTDMLTKRLPPESINGLFVSHAHRLTTNFNDAFILRLYRRRNKAGFVKAVSDRPDMLTRGFAAMEKIMRHLGIRHVHLFPRFHQLVEESFSNTYGCQPTTSEVGAEMTSLSAQIQLAILKLIEKGLVQLEKNCGSHVDLHRLTSTESLFSALDVQLRDILDPVWHKLNDRTRKHVTDLSAIRKLLAHLHRYDCVQFYSILENMKIADEVDAAWLMTGEAETIFHQAKARIYKVVRRVPSDETASTAPNDPCLRLTLEPCPKWSTLKDLIVRLCDAQGVEPHILAKLAIRNHLIAFASSEVSETSSGHLTESRREAIAKAATSLYRSRDEQPG